MLLGGRKKKSNCYLAAPQPTFGHYRQGSLTQPMLITLFLHIWPKSHGQPRNKVGSLSLAKHLVGFEQEHPDSDYNTLSC